MRIIRLVLFVAPVAAVVSAQSSPSTASSPATSDTSSIPAELAAIAECNTTQLNESQVILTSNQRADQCEEALSLQSGTMLQVTTEDATAMCDTASCRAALQELYNNLPDCRYNLWGLQHSAKQLLEYCGVTPKNTSDVDSGNSLDWSTSSRPGTDSFAPVGATDAPSTADNSTSDSPTPAQQSSASTPMTALPFMRIFTTDFL
ncbi:hypothetical protein F443_11381 [Plasmopara halstedii]|uniref:Elicitin n=1 Tax=Plasmopara halstedii TaxID=4781 RepID=A0A0P1B6I8_PLAHL|nr:hypothetical protein F443_11381 [Plasmopara halstedii]CEG50094.1 hypothetical protein F443_11381 [Plasmopara halstedii]|eukprot:XP_024586463.1 hypothetical protein F443_11381 [Plasmopara halstedii]